MPRRSPNKEGMRATSPYIYTRARSFAAYILSFSFSQPFADGAKTRNLADSIKH